MLWTIDPIGTNRKDSFLAKIFSQCSANVKCVTEREVVNISHDKMIEMAVEFGCTEAYSFDGTLTFDHARHYINGLIGVVQFLINHNILNQSEIRCNYRRKSHHYFFAYPVRSMHCELTLNRLHELSDRRISEIYLTLLPETSIDVRAFYQFAQHIKRNFSEQLLIFTEKESLGDLLTDHVLKKWNISGRPSRKRLMLNAAAKACVHIVALLIDEGVDVNTQCKQGRTPLHYAVLSRSEQLIELLLARGANLDIQDERGNTALHYAVQGQMTNVIDRFIGSGAHCELKNELGYTPLYLAVKLDFEEIASYFINAGANPNVQSEQGHCALHYTVINQNLDLLDALLKNGASVDQVNSRGMTPLFFAVELKRAAFAALLLQYGADPFIRSKELTTPYSQAFHDRDPTIMDAFFDSDVDINRFDRFGVHNNEESSFQTPLTYAIIQSDYETVKKLLEHHADPNLKAGEIGFAPLHYAASKDSRFVRLLLRKGADPNRQSVYGETPLHYAVNENNFSGTISLLNGGQADPNLSTFQQQINPLELAVRKRNRKIVEILLQHNADPNACNVNGISSLHIAANNGDTSIIDLLLKYNANHHSNSSEDLEESDAILSPLHRAVYSAKYSAIRSLLDAGSSINIVDRIHGAPLHIAVKKRDIDLLDFLLEKGAMINRRDELGCTPLYLAVADNDLGFVKHLLSKHANADIACQDGERPLHRAILNKNREMIEVLLANGVNVNVVCNEGDSPLHLAAICKMPVIVQKLLDYGASPNAVNSSKRTALHYAVLSEDTHSVRTLVGHHSINLIRCCNIRDCDDNTPFLLALEKRNAEIAKMTIHNEATVHEIKQFLALTR